MGCDNIATHLRHLHFVVEADCLELCHIQSALTSRSQRLFTLNTYDSLFAGVVLAQGQTWPFSR